MIKGPFDSLTTSDILAQIPEIQAKFDTLVENNIEKLDSFLEIPNISGVKGLKLLLLEWNDVPEIKRNIAKALEFERYIRGKLRVYGFSIDKLNIADFKENQAISNILDNKGDMPFAEFLSLVQMQFNLSKENEELSEQNGSLTAQLLVLQLNSKEREEHPLAQQSTLLSKQMKNNEKEKESILLKIESLGPDYKALAHFIDCQMIVETLTEKLASFDSILLALDDLPPRKTQVLKSEDNEEWEATFASNVISPSTPKAETNLGTESDEEDWDVEMGFEDVSPVKRVVPEFLHSFKKLRDSNSFAQEEGTPDEPENEELDSNEKPKMKIDFQLIN